VSAAGAEPFFSELSGEALNLAREAAVAAVERRFVDELMRRSDGNVSLASREAGLHRSYLQKLLARHRLELGVSPEGS
jgi:DNA-binding protein Fis